MATKTGTEKRYTVESVGRALSHHTLTGVLHTVSPPYTGRPKWHVTFPGDLTYTEFTTAEAFALCLGLAAAERHYARKDADA